MKPRYRDRRYRPESWLSAIQVHESAGITYRQLDYWCTNGWLKPDEGNPGVGRGRSFSAVEADVARTMAQLVRLGVTPKEAHRIARELEEHEWVVIGDFMLVKTEVPA